MLEENTAYVNEQLRASRPLRRSAQKDLHLIEAALAHR